MQLRISSCKRTAFRKDIGRFAPLWIGWGMFLVLLMLTLSENDPDFWFLSNMAGSLQIMGIFTCGYALLTALCLFGDLFNSRMCHALHAMPLNREHWFSVHIRAGLFFQLVPVTLVAGAAAVWLYGVSAMPDGWQIPLYWWAGTNLGFLFFFGLAVFSLMCAGNRVGTLVLYGVLNFASVLVMFLVDSLYIPLLHGFVTPVDRFMEFCPVVQLSLLRYLNCTRAEDVPGASAGFRVLAEHWNYPVILALSGVFLLILARGMYKKRRMECAGDFSALPALTPVMQVILTLMTASAFAAVNTFLFGNSGLMTVYMGAGLFVGWFGIRMLMTRSTRVFQPASWAALLILTALLAGSLYLTKLDPAGVVDWVPRVSQVRSASLEMMNYSTRYDTEDPAEIADLLQIHTLALEDKFTSADDPATENGGQNPLVGVNLTYELENGFTVRRRYYLPGTSEEGRLAAAFFSRPICILQNHTSLHDATSETQLFDLADVPRSIQICNRNVPRAFLTESFADELVTAIAADSAAGNLAQNRAFHDSFEGLYFDALYLDMSLKNGHHLFLYIYPECTNTITVLEKTGVPEELRQLDRDNLYG